METFDINQFSNDTRYAEAVARIRVLETRLLPARKFLRMAEREDWQGVLDELRGTDYAEPLAQVDSAKELEAALVNTTLQRHRIVRELPIESHLVRAILSWHDFTNLKILLKKEWGDHSREGALSPLGNISSEELKARLAKHQPLPRALQTTLETVEQDFRKNHSLSRVEILIDKAYLEWVRQAFYRSSIPFLHRFIDYRIDLLNIRHMLRWRHWDAAPKVDWQLFPAGGVLPREKLELLQKSDNEKLASVLAFTIYGDFFNRAMTFYLQTGELWLLEKLSDDFLTAFCARTRYTAFGVEPLIAYLWVLLQEMRNIQLILRAKYLRLPAEEVKQRLRRTYD